MRALLVLVVLASMAHAQPSLTAPAEPQEVTTTSWYGYQAIFADLASVSLMVAGVNANNASAFGVGLIGYLAGGPTVHGLNHHATRAAVSLGLRVLLPITVGAIVAAANADEDGAVIGLIAGSVLGGGGAMLIDDAFVPHTNKITLPRIMPTVLHGPPGSLSFGVTGRF